MNQPDRTIKPAAHPIGPIQMIEPALQQLENNLPVFELSAGTQELVKIELIFNAGSSHHTNPLIPAFTLSMLQEGTRHRKAAEIASAIDDYGAFLETDHDKDFSGVMLFTLNRYLKETLPVVLEIITEPVFPENEWEILRSNRLDKFRINMGKVSFIAGKRFQELLFSNSAYGNSFGEDTYRESNREALIDFKQNHYSLNQALVFVSGHIDDGVRETINQVLGTSALSAHQFDKVLPASHASSTTEREQFILKEDAIQSAIRIGRRLFTKTHPDYFGMKILTTVLGGYFGSRLMSNIREDKGYTYGIGAGIATYLHDGYFVISTEVGADVCRNALDEIYKEIEQLQQQPIPDEELNLVKNYLLGNLLKSFDGPMERMERFKSVHLFGLDLSYYSRYAEAIRQANAAYLQQLAQTWLQKEDLIELVVGKK
jgi:predicted Zn-dependent peptidase